MNNSPSTNHSHSLGRPKEKAEFPESIDECVKEAEQLLAEAEVLDRNNPETDGKISEIDQRIKKSLAKLHAVTEFVNGSLTPEKSDYIFDIVMKLTGNKKIINEYLPHYLLRTLISPHYQRNKIKRVMTEE